MYSARPAEFVSQMPAFPVSVFRASVVPEAVAPEAVVPEAAEAGAEVGAADAAADDVAAGVVGAAAAADEELDELLQAASSTATPTSGRLTPNVRSEVLRDMTILPL